MARSKQLEAIEGESLRVAETGMLPAIAPVDDDGDDDADLSAVLNELDGDTQATVKLYRSLRGGKLSYVEEYRPNEWLQVGESGVRDQFGAGEYEIRVYDNRKKIRKRKSFSIDAARATNPVTVVPPPIDIAAVVQAVMREIAPMFASIVKPPAQDRQEFLQEMLLMRQIFGGDGAAKSPDPLELLRSVIGITKEIAPREGESGPYDVFAKLVEQFGPVITANMASSAQAAPNPAAGPPPPRVAAAPPLAEGMPANPVPNPTPAVQSSEAQNVDMMQYAMRFLCEQAARGADPGLYAELALDHLAEDQIGQILSVDDATLLQTLAVHDARIMQHGPWFLRMRQEIRQLLTDDTEPEHNIAPGENTTPQA
jgi:hypothetical protein